MATVPPVGIAVLHDQRADLVRMLERQPQTYRGNIIHQVQSIAAHPEMLHKAVHQAGVVRECVGELSAIRHRALSEAGTIRCDDVIVVREQGDQVAEDV
jgi:hypothetical protein